MRNIVKVLLQEGIEREDVVTICKYIKETYTEDELKGLTHTSKKWLLKTMDPEIGKDGATQLKTYSKEDALKNAQAMSRRENEIKALRKKAQKEFEKNHPKQEQQETVNQLGLFN